MADAEGLEAVTLVRLAKELNVRTPSLYNHVDGLKGIHRALALKGMREANARMSKAGRRCGRRRCSHRDRQRLSRVRAGAPGLYMASLRAPAEGDNELAEAAGEIVGTVTAVLASYGLKGEDVLHATRGLRANIHGFVCLEAAGGLGLSLDLQESPMRLLKIFGQGLSRSVVDS